MHLLYPSFLLGLLAIGIPVAIHLLHLRRPQRVLFTNTGFIRQVELTTIHRRRLQELLVLAARVLAVAFIVLMFCQPFIPVAHSSAQAAIGTVGVLVDNSGSMQSPGLVQPKLTQAAVNSASALGKIYGVSTRFKLIGQRGTNMSGTAYELAVNAQGESSTQVGWGSAAVRTALQDEQLGSLFLFSDFQKNEVKPSFWQNIRRVGDIVLVPQVARSTGNIYVDSLWLNDAFVRARTNVGLHIRFRNGGGEAVADCPVKVLLNGRQVAIFRVTVEAGQISEAVAQVQVPDDKLASGEVVTGDTPVTFDNTFYFTMQPAATIRILEIGLVPATQQAYAREPLFTYSFVKPQAINYGELRQANLVVLREVPQVDAGLREALAGVMRRGGSVVIVPPASQVAHASYHELFRALGIGGEQWEAPIAGASVRQEVAMPDLRNPFFKDVFGAQPRQVTMPQVAPVLRTGQAGTDIIMRLRDGAGYLTEFESGAGRAYVFAAPFAEEYSDFAAHALFVPVLYRLAMLSYHVDQPLAYRLTTPALTLALPSIARPTHGTRDEASYRLVRDSLTYIPTQRVQSGQLRLDVPPDLRVPGFYSVVKQGKVLTTLAFNGDKRESELRAYSAAELRQLLGDNHPNVRVLDAGAQPEAIARYRAEQAGQPLWRYCLLAALVCLLAEALLLRFGRPRAGAGSALA
jgi:hypothetical protein